MEDFVDLVNRNIGKILLGLLILLLVGIPMLAHWTSKSGCEKFGEVAQTETVYHWNTGCLVKAGNKWVPVDSLRTVEEGRK